VWNALSVDYNTREQRYGELAMARSNTDCHINRSYERKVLIWFWNTVISIRTKSTTICTEL